MNPSRNRKRKARQYRERLEKKTHARWYRSSPMPLFLLEMLMTGYDYRELRDGAYSVIRVFGAKHPTIRKDPVFDWFARS